ncbi:hypothetical protein [Streptomyces sp.]|uniref:hypothetical protein n=1 Tax=Streptomyces sp. TaxID=1931 RepID=UPI002F95A65D
MTDLDQNAALSSSRLEEIRDLNVDSCSAGAPYNPDVWTLEKARTDLLAHVDSLTETAYNQARMLSEITDACVAVEGDALRHRTQVAELSAEVQRLKAALAKEEETSGGLIDERDHMEKLLDTFAYTLAPEEVIGEHSSGNDPWQNALDLVTSVAEVDRLRDLAAERDQAVASARHLAGAMAKVGPALLEALRLAAAGDAASAAAVLGDVAPEGVEEGGEVRG